MNTNRWKLDTNFINYGLYAFGGLGLEILLLLLETQVWSVMGISETLATQLIHWMFTSILWIGMGIWLYRKLPCIDTKVKHIDIWRMLPIIICSIALTTFCWNGIKPVMEYQHLGFIKFIAQYFYYIWEALLITLMISFGQHMIKEHKRNQYIPMGGIFLAITWGLIHILTQGMSTGIYACVQAILYGIVYIGLKKNFTYSYLVILFMFMV